MWPAGREFETPGVVSAESVNSFKSRLDKVWSMHDFVYDYRASPLAAVSCV